MLKGSNLFGPVDKVQIAIDRIKLFEKNALVINPEGYWVAFSGGKDSIVVLDLVRRAGVKHTAHFNITTIDSPELMQYIKKEYPDIIRDRPEISMWQLIVKKMMPPTQTVRYCCEFLKERGGIGYWVITGIRWEESDKRKNRKMTEHCFKNDRKFYLNPIIDWTEDEVWEYIHKRKLPYCCLYDEGFRRIGCIGCPLSTPAERKQQFKRWPGFERSYRRAFAAAAANRLKLGNSYGQDGDKHQRWENGDDMFKWWISKKSGKSDTTGLFFQ